MSSDKNHHLLVLPYLADYRRGFIDELESRLHGRLTLVHPNIPLDPTVRVVHHKLSVPSEPVRSLPFGLESQRHIVRNVASLSPKTVTIEANVRDISYLRLLLWCRIRRVPACVWGLGRYTRDRTVAERWGGDLITFTLVSLSNHVIAKGEGSAKYYRKFTRNDSKVTVAPNSSGLEEDLVHIDLDERPGPIDELNLLFVGRVTPAKDLDVLLKALAEIRDGAWALRIVGDGDEVGPLRDTAHELGLSTRVHFLGNQSGDDLVQSFSASDALVLPGKGGLVIPEALAAGLPIVTGPLDHAGDGTLDTLLEDGYNAFISDARGPEGLRRAIERLSLAQKSGHLPRYRVQARKAYKKHGGVRAMAHAFTAFMLGPDEPAET